MAWTSPKTANVGEVFSAADWNTYVRDNLKETMPGRASAALDYFVCDTINHLAVRTASNDRDDASETTTSTSYTDLGGVADPTVTVTSGKRALAFWSVQMSNSGANINSVSVAVSGATTVAADDDWAIILDGVAANSVNRFGGVHLFTDLTAGSNTFTVKYKVSAGTGTFLNREIIVVPF